MGGGGERREGEGRGGEREGGEGRGREGRTEVHMNVKATTMPACIQALTP